MAVEAIGGMLGSGINALERSGVNQDDFIRLFLTQLSFQDPLEPVDNREFLAQLAQFSSVEQLRTLGDNIEALLSLQASTQSVGLLGRTVEASTMTETVVGQVTTLSYRTGKPLLTILKSDGTVVQDISPAQISLVR